MPLSDNARVATDQRLAAMGVSRWQLRHPHFYPDLSPTLVNLPDACRLLLVCDDTLSEQDAWLFGRILQSMNLTPDDALMLPSDGVAQLGEHQLAWIWFAGCNGSAPEGLHQLSSPSLQALHDQPAAKKQLWQQICRYL
uniref:DNA polymerase III subunit psi n=1 Tax=Thaumasiovibrio occultus TaxID=1891184 RepID=UPI000B35A355|nr:DNA polymerase III subunit psi [Thaumasiovibrio occultus]